MNIAVIFAGGVGKRMKTNGIPKQFLEVYGKPILIYTLEKFENNQDIDAIVVSCLEEKMDYCKKLVDKYEITKVRAIVKGGKTGQESIYNGLKAAEQISETDKDIVLIHDGVRPLIDDEIIDNNIKCVKENGSAITCVECKETVVILDDNDNIKDVTDRSRSRLARAPQSFYLKDILAAHRKALEDGKTDVIDSCTLMRMYGKEVSIVIGKSENIKITTPDDYYMFKAMLDMKENSNIFGI